MTTPLKPRLITKYAYIDTSSFEDEEFDWDGTVLSRLIKLVKFEELTLLTTIITEKEIIKRMQIHLSTMQEGFRFYKKGIIEQLNLVEVIPMIDSRMAMPKLISRFRQFNINAKITKIEITSDVNTVLDQYFDVRPPFTSKKPDEFRDAIAIQSVREWATSKYAKVYLVSKDSDWESCCTENSPFIYRKSIDALVSDAKLMVQDKRNIRNEIVRRNEMIRNILCLISKLPIHCEALPPYRGGLILSADDLSIIKVEMSGANYFDFEVVELDIDSEQLLCTARLEAEIYFDVPYHICRQMYEGDPYILNNLRPSASGGRRLYSDEMFRVEFEISEFDPSNLGKMKIGEVRLLNTSTKTKLYYHG